METQLDFPLFVTFICSKSLIAVLVVHVNMFQVVDVKTDTKLKSPDSSFSGTTFECYSILLLAYYTSVIWAVRWMLDVIY